MNAPPAELLVAQRSAADWAPTVDELALQAVLDDCAYLRAYGGRETRWLDQALCIKRDQVERATRSYERRQLECALKACRCSLTGCMLTEGWRTRQ